MPYLSPTEYDRLMQQVEVSSDLLEALEWANVSMTEAGLFKQNPDMKQAIKTAIAKATGED